MGDLFIPKPLSCEAFVADQREYLEVLGRAESIEGEREEGRGSGSRESMGIGKRVARGA